VPGPVNRGDGAGGLGRIGDHRSPGAVERLGLGFLGNRFGGADLVAVKQHLHSPQMIGLVEQAVEFGQENPGVAVVHGEAAPAAGGNSAGAPGIARDLQGPDQRDGALGGFGGRFAKCGEHFVCRGVFEEQGAFRQLAQRREPGPALQLGCGESDLVRGHAFQARHRDRPGQDMMIKRVARNGIADRPGAGRVVVAKRFQTCLEFKACRCRHAGLEHRRRGFSSNDLRPGRRQGDRAVWQRRGCGKHCGKREQRGKSDLRHDGIPFEL